MPRREQAGALRISGSEGFFHELHEPIFHEFALHDFCAPNLSLLKPPPQAPTYYDQHKQVFPQLAQICAMSS